ncbi:MAG TPA: DoxX family protein [Thermoanaerobaculia bacterium]|nr:DoxX family protein [Thermoanaerobaculia bacterium]
MERLLGRFEPHLFALLRIVAGLMFALHGTQKLLGWPEARPMRQLPPLIMTAGLIETVGGLMIALGLFGSIAAFICSGQMAVAYFWRHAPDGFWPTVNKGELAVLYCFLFLFIAAYGSGIWSIDSLRRGAAGRREKAETWH